MIDDSQAEWERIHSIANFVESDNCWKDCGSYCCATSHPDFNFRFIRPGMVHLPMPPSEYRYLERIGKLQETGRGSVAVRSVEFANGRVASVYMMRCSLGGVCRHPDFRPLICKIYPFFPVPSPSGEIETITEGSVFDTARAMKDNLNACTLKNRYSSKMLEQTIERYRQLFRGPHVIFYFRAAYELMKIMKRSIAESREELLAKNVKDYFYSWEILYMTGALTPKDEVIEALRCAYDEVKAVWGDFATE